MNSDRENSNRAYSNHYADFDEHGNRRTNRKGDDRASSGDSRNRDSQRNDNSPSGSNYTRAYGDYSGGTRYGEGGSTYGGGSAYGQTNYGPNRDHGPHNAARDRNQSEHVRNGYGDYTDYDSRNYGSFAGSSDYSDYMYYNYGPDSWRTFGNRDDNRGSGDYGSTGRGSTGYDNSYREYGNTGYGSTGYNNRDEDRERSTNSRGNYDNASRNERFYHGGDYNPRDQGNNPFPYRDRDEKNR